MFRLTIVLSVLALDESIFSQTSSVLVTEDEALDLVNQHCFTRQGDDALVAESGMVSFELHGATGFDHAWDLLDNDDEEEASEAAPEAPSAFHSALYGVDDEGPEELPEAIVEELVNVSYTCRMTATLPNGVKNVKEGKQKLEEETTLDEVIAKLGDPEYDEDSGVWIREHTLNNVRYQYEYTIQVTPC